MGKKMSLHDSPITIDLRVEVSSLHPFKGLFLLVTSNHGNHFLESLNGWEMSVSPTSFHTMSSKKRKRKN